MTNYSEVGSTLRIVRRAGGSMTESSEPKLEQQMDLTQAMSLSVGWMFMCGAVGLSMRLPDPTEPSWQPMRCVLSFIILPG